MAFTLEIAQAAPDFRLPGVDGREYALADFARASTLVVFFTCNHCPHVVGSQERLLRLHEAFHPRGVDWVGINSNWTGNHPEDDFEHMQQCARQWGFRHPYLRDESQEAARAYGALRTPHFFVFDAQRLLRYTGRMDDNPRDASKATTHELRDALEALLAGRRPPVAAANPIGCNVKWANQEEHWMPEEACDLI